MRRRSRVSRVFTACGSTRLTAMVNKTVNCILNLQPDLQMLIFDQLPILSTHFTSVLSRFCRFRRIAVKQNNFFIPIFNKQ